jgi:hypothetical protein
MGMRRKSGGYVGFTTTTSTDGATGAWNAVDQFIANKADTWPYAFGVITNATGGTISSDATTVTHTFPASGTFNVSETTGNRRVEVEQLLLAGGGGGGGSIHRGGGGGAGGLYYDSAFVYEPGSFTINVGAGGPNSGQGESSFVIAPGVAGFSSHTAYGGGFGRGGTSGTGGPGGSGGGGCHNGTAGGTATAKDPLGNLIPVGTQGNPGGAGSYDGTGGGGGASASGANSNGPNNGGNGGAGAPYSISGTAVTYAGGGGGAPSGTGGSGGGGSANNPGTDGLGGGGGGNVSNSPSGLPGGDGIVIIKYNK